MPVASVARRAVQIANTVHIADVVPEAVSRAAAHPAISAAVAATSSAMLRAHPEAEDKDENVSEAGEEWLAADYWMMAGYFACFLLAVAIIITSCWVFVWSNSFPDRTRRYAAVLGIESQHLMKSTSMDLEEKVKGDWQSRIMQSGEMQILKNWFNILLVVMPLGWCSYWFHWGDTTTFLLNLVAILPLANLMGEGTEELSCHTGQTIGGLLNATFGNAVELIVVIQSLRQGLVDVTKGTLLGSILANELLVLGMALFFGGLFEKDNVWRIAKNRQQNFSPVGAMVQAQLLIFSSFVICMPTMFNQSTHVTSDHVLHISRMGSIFVLLGYVIFLTFQLYTHQELISGANVDEEEEEEARIGWISASILLLVATILVAISSECLVHALEGFTKDVGFSETFVGVILLPIVGNACEHSTAVIVAMKDKLTLAIGIALGSSIQISLLVIPVAVLVGWGLDVDMDLNFKRVNSWALILSSLLIICVLVTGKSNWLNGFLLLSAYGVLAILYFFTPDGHV
eukprot:gnl/TRDRNA2_/TRDRNA2_185752_c0_seq1.p1 gnl/TRDRNA2_/TRDRNA2_185752_c0~~gnl/TRDRNA2_/TRDRNA2_185752_c0_seq1.p1  ORF type:complete len:515 (+),score=88.88 gnl/TRDRNA2_/TRDRNA2_185752_c0_seq1:103-1647(+)